MKVGDRVVVEDETPDKKWGIGGMPRDLVGLCVYDATGLRGELTKLADELAEVELDESSKVLVINPKRLRVISARHPLDGKQGS